MSTIKDSLVVNVPASVAYQQWAQFDEFPKFMEGIEEVKRLDENRYHLRAKVAGKREEWDAEITDQIPDRRISWRSINGIKNDGTVEFEPMSDTSTRVSLEMDYEPHGILEKIGDAIGADKRRLHRDLKHFKDFIEHQNVSA